MRAVVQRVKRASVCINGAETRAIGPGILVLIGVKDGDSVALCSQIDRKSVV
jgi:D-tyrosyl-tRNA(Tyr) deacylase